MVIYAHLSSKCRQIHQSARIGIGVEIMSFFLTRVSMRVLSTRGIALQNGVDRCRLQTRGSCLRTLRSSLLSMSRPEDCFCIKFWQLSKTSWLSSVDCITSFRLLITNFSIDLNISLPFDIIFIMYNTNVQVFSISFCLFKLQHLNFFFFLFQNTLLHEKLVKQDINLKLMRRPMKVYKAPEHVVHILDLSIYLVWSEPMFWSQRCFCQTLPLNDCVND